MFQYVLNDKDLHTVQYILYITLLLNIKNLLSSKLAILHNRETSVLRL